MSELMDVEFEDGVLEDVPVGTPKSVIRDKAIRAGLLEPTPEPAEDERSLTQKVLQSEYLDIGTGFGGALAGAGLGFVMGGPVGAIIGGVVGGAGGTAGGELAEDYFQGKELDYYNAFREAAISAGIDVATLGTGKYVGKPLINYIKHKRSLGMSPSEAAAEYVKQAKPTMAAAGTSESLMASQSILEKGGRGATLTPYQVTGEYGVTQRLADIGIFSQVIGERNYRAVNETVSESLDELMGRIGTDGVDPRSLGQTIYSTIEAGRQASFQIYDEGMSKLQSQIGNSQVNTLGFKQTMQRFLNAGQREGKAAKVADRVRAKGFSVYDKATLDFVNKIQSDLIRMPSMSASSLIDYEKKMMRQIQKFSSFGAKEYNEQAARELAELSSKIRSAVSRELERLDPKAAKEYSRIKTAYGEAIEGVLPTNLKPFVARAKEGQYQALGQLAGTTGSLDHLSRMLSSLEESHKQIRKAGGKVGVESLEQAVGKLRAGFLQSQIPNYASPDFDIKKYKTLSTKFSKPKERARLEMIMGNQAPKANQLFNLMSEASQAPTSNLGELMLRTKEYQAVAAAATVAGGPVAMTGAAGVLLAPVFLAKAAYNPKIVNKLIAFEKTNFKTQDAMLIAAANVVADVMQDLSEEDQAEIRNYFRDTEMSTQP